MVNGNAYPPWGCYREQEAPCQCRAAPKYDRGARGGYGYGRGGGRRRGEEYDDDEEEEEYAGRGRFDEELPEEAVEEVGECPCHWCSGERCHPPACEVCATKANPKPNPNRNPNPNCGAKAQPNPHPNPHPNP